MGRDSNNLRISDRKINPRPIGDVIKPVVERVLARDGSNRGGHRQRYTPAQKAQITALWLANKSVSEIARTLGKNRNSLDCWIKRNRADLELQRSQLIREARPAPAIREDSFVRRPSMAQLMAGR